MVLNYIWIAFFLIAFAVCIGKTCFSRRYPGLSRDYQFNLQFFQNCIRDFIGIDRRAFTLARNYEDRRRKGESLLCSLNC